MDRMDDLATAQGHFEQALQMSRALGDHINTAWALIFLGYAHMRETETALAMAEEGLSMFQTLHHQAGIAQALNTIGEIARFGGDDARARQAYDACLAMSDESRETRLTRHACGNLAFLAQHAGEYERARALAVHGVRIALAMDIELDIADSLATLAGVIAATGQVEQAARLLGTWDAALVRMGVQPDLPDRAEHERTIALARARLDAASFEAAWAVGRAMSLEQAAVLALERGDA
jgi:tetratricopeptide (TPR) repeat protein